MHSSFFFFQAEDGIRDLTVTGVQTCALPIYLFCSSGWVGAFARPRSSTGSTSPRPNKCHQTRFTPARDKNGLSRDAIQTASRSEERRVGEEGRSRWSPDH